MVERLRTTPAQENYIAAIYNLSLKKPVRPGTLAATLGVKKASVSKYIAKLVAIGLVHHIPRGTISLTDQGIELAERLLQRKQCLTRLLVDLCNMKPADAAPEVHRLEHLVSDDVLFRLETLVKFACSSSAWLKRLHLRLESEQSTGAMPQRMKVGSSQVHPVESLEQIDTHELK